MPGRLMGMARCLLVAGLMVTAMCGEAAAQSAAVPTSWSKYAGLVGHQFQAWLMGDDEVAYRLHKFLEDRVVSQTDKPPGPLMVKVWIDANGQVSRVDFSSLGQPQADADLRRLLTANPLSEPPPPEMRQPLMLRLNLQFKS